MRTCSGCLSFVLISLFLIVLIIVCLFGALYYGMHSSNGGGKSQGSQNALVMIVYLTSE